MHFLIICVFCICTVRGLNLDMKNVTSIQISNNSYFGYSILLQKGTSTQQPIVIVGAPGQGSTKSGGSVYSCLIDSRECSKFMFDANSENSFTGNFLGVSLDGGENTGEELVACAPRIVTKSMLINDVNHYLKGFCFLKSNSLDNSSRYTILGPLYNEPPIKSYRYGQKSVSYYDNAFAEAGLAIHYLKDSQSVVFGAPGIKGWNGALVTQALSNLRVHTVIPDRSAPILNEVDTYLGYTVTTARFDSNRRSLWAVAGAPRASGLNGQVKIYQLSQGTQYLETSTLAATLTGYEIGSYFGSAILASDLNNDQIDDLLVGAPTGAGSTWDEGYVYFYRRDLHNFKTAVQIYGSRKKGARFGSALAALGDIDLDSYNDVAISAPYEDDGTGAVYVYMGSSTGINSIYSQRLTPTAFPFNLGRDVRGFGLGLSRGVDIDGNGHNDVAIGAYKSGHVFIIKSVSIIDYKISLQSNVSSISTGGMEVTFCIFYTQRSKKIMTEVKFTTQLLLDYRTDGAANTTDTYLIPATGFCKSLIVSLKQTQLDILPFKMSLRVAIVAPDVIGIGENQIEKSVPYAHDCGDDNVCQTELLLQMNSKPPNITLGLDNEIIIFVTVDNSGEPGYGCQLLLNVSEVLEMRNTRDCISENSTFACPFSNKLVEVKIVEFKFDVNLKTPTIDKLFVNAELKCLGENQGLAGDDKREVVLNVVRSDSPNVQVSSVTENAYFNEKDTMKDIQLEHVFTVSNSGPSPLKLDVYILLPVVKSDGVDIFEAKAKGSLNGIEIPCYSINRTIGSIEKTYDVGSFLTKPLNRTIVVDCFEEGVECLELYCNGEYLYKTSELAKYTVKVVTKTGLLASHYRQQLFLDDSKKDVIAYISTAYLLNSSNKTIEAHASTVISVSKTKPLPIWIYIVGGIIGLLLLVVVTFLLYKCHFFDRNYRDKLNDEKLMDDRVEYHASNPEEEEGEGKNSAE